MDAVAASCAVPGVWPPVTIGDRRFIDGGVRSTVNADLAGGADRVVVIAPIAMGLNGSIHHEIEALEAEGSEVAVVVADEASVAAFGTNPLHPATREPSARAGRAQGPAVAEAVAEVWG